MSQTRTRARKPRPQLLPWRKTFFAVVNHARWLSPADQRFLGGLVGGDRITWEDRKRLDAIARSLGVPDTWERTKA